MALRSILLFVFSAFLISSPTEAVSGLGLKKVPAVDIMRGFPPMKKGDIAMAMKLMDAILADLTEEDVQEMLGALAQAGFPGLDKIDPALVVAELKGRNAADILAEAQMGGEALDMKAIMKDFDVDALMRDMMDAGVLKAQV